MGSWEVLKGAEGSGVVYQFTCRAVAVPMRRATLREVMPVKCIVSDRFGFFCVLER